MFFRRCWAVGERQQCARAVPADAAAGKGQVRALGRRRQSIYQLVRQTRLEAEGGTLPRRLVYDQGDHPEGH